MKSTQYTSSNVFFYFGLIFDLMMPHEAEAWRGEATQYTHLQGEAKNPPAVLGYKSPRVVE